MAHSSLKDYVFTSESVSEGHPDKVCDRISDTILDRFMSIDPGSRTAIETVTTTNYVGIFGECKGPASIDKQTMEDIARECIRDIGYEQDDFHWRDVNIDVRVHQQSADIAMGVDDEGVEEAGAGDQGIMFGYACRETDAYMPAAIHYSHAILRSLADARHAGRLPDLGPDAKSQIALEYRDGQPVGATSIVVSTQHSEAVSQLEVRDMIRPHVEAVLPDGWMCPEEEFYVNPTGRFVIGGPVGDAGLTGRKIIVDTYGGAAPHGGGAFSGKDPSKVDRSATYAARYLAKNIVAAGYADQCLIQLSYAIGVARPISIYVNTQGTGKADESDIAAAFREVMDLSPVGIRNHLNLDRPIYARSACYGHFGRNPDDDGGFSWEKLDLVKPLQDKLG